MQGLKPQSSGRKGHGKQEGYILLMLMLFVGLLAITAVTMAPTLAFQLRRDREEEMVHRGVQYSRAIRRYYKKFGRYPSRVEDLESSNNMRFLRRRYKDPITGKDFKLLHVGEVKMNFAGGIAGALPAGMNPANGNQAVVDQGLPGGAFGRAGNAGGAGGIGLVGTSGGATPTAPAAGADSDSDAGDSDTGNKDAAQSGDNSSQSSQSGFDFSKSGNSSPVFGGGAIVGVVGLSTDKTIREFNDKKHYNEWQFIYDPTMDRGGLLTAPGQPRAGNMGQPIAPGAQNGQPGTGPGQPAAPAAPTPPTSGNQGSDDNDQD